MTDSPAYREKKAFFDKVLTAYGRNPVLEILQDDTLVCHAVHLADSNRDTGIIARIKERARQLGVPVKMHSREELARISRNGRQDQGVAVDVVCPSFRDLAAYLSEPSQRPRRLLALDGITNPQNLGMIIRSAAAGSIDGILLPRKGSAALGPLAIKASAGTLFRAPLLLCTALPEALSQCKAHGAQVCTLNSASPDSFFRHQAGEFTVYVLGNETDGVSASVSAVADVQLAIPMCNGVESLNVAVTASLIAYGTYLER